MGTTGVIILTAIVTFVATAVLLKGYDYLRQKDAEKQAKDIVERAEREIDNRRREAELEIKELAIQQR
ncbi:MAG TPA: Rnase Y domain-containing protein, partial [Pirellulales bacterium]|nr:Rnase Y domain-containing protein [Pirellulales bacterium]